MTEPWDRQPGEGDEAWEAFVLYRDMGARRSQESVGGKLGKSRQLMSRWSAEHGWVARAGAWDREQDRVRREAHLEEIAEMSRRHATEARALQTAILRPAHELLRRLQANELDLTSVKVSALIEMALAAARAYPGAAGMERLARGVPTEITSTRIDVGADLGLEERLELAREIAADPKKRAALHDYLLALYGAPTADADGGSGDAGGAGDPPHPGPRPALGDGASPEDTG